MFPFCLIQVVTSDETSLLVKDTGMDNYFDPSTLVNRVRTQTRWVDFNGVTLPSLASATASVTEITELAYDAGVDCSVGALAFRDPSSFMAGGLHACLDQWRLVTSRFNGRSEVLDWLENGVDIRKYFQHFRGNFQGCHYDSGSPVSREFKNAASCNDFKDFIVDTLKERMLNGSILWWGKTGDCVPPTVVIPLVIEPTKPRLCLDARYVNLWIKDLPFTLDTLRDVPRLIQTNGYMTSCDEAKGYDHILLESSCQQYFGFLWAEHYYVFRTIPFGFRASPYIYQTTGMVVSHYVRSLGIPCLQYVDDRLNGQQCLGASQTESPYTLAERAIFIVCSLLTALGYTIALNKSQLIPVHILRFLGMMIDAVRGAFVIPQDKRQKFHDLLCLVLAARCVDLRTLQRLQGKCVSFLLAVPAAKLYIREMSLAISKTSRNSKRIAIQGDLQSELQHWLFLRNWAGVVPWRQEKHLQICLASDASSFRWGGVILSGDSMGVNIGDYFQPGDTRPIHVKEGEAVIHVLQSVADRMKDHRVDIFVDNKAVCDAWARLGAKDKQLTTVLKRLYEFTSDHNVELRIHYIPSAVNPADPPSRKLSASDTCLSNAAWRLVEQVLGPHGVDLMSLDSNCMQNSRGQPIRHFTPEPSPGSAGVNVFAQDISKETNPYVFPPFILVGPLLRFLVSQNISRCTMVIPTLYPLPYWWPLLQAHVCATVCIGKKGQTGILCRPSRAGFVLDSIGLQWDLFAYRMNFA